MSKTPIDFVVWLDPGLVTGWASLMGGYHFDSGQGIHPEIGELLEDYGVVYRDRMALGWEQYIVTSGGAKGGSAGPPIEVIGMSRWLGYKYEMQMLKPVPSAMRTVASPEMLKKLGWYAPGMDHANQAARHMLAWLMRENRLSDEARRILFEEDCQTPAA